MRLICVHAVDVLAVVTSSPPRTPATGSINAGSSAVMPSEMALKSACACCAIREWGYRQPLGMVLFFM